MLETLATFYAEGGFWMHPIALCSLVACTLAGERIFVLFRRLNTRNVPALMSQIQKCVVSNNIEKAIALCGTQTDAALPRVMKAALTRANKSEEDIANAIEESMLEVVPEITKRVSLLPNLANLATLLGLLGTIIGLIQAFSAVALAPPEMKSQLLTQALAIGLNATAFGLVVAIPTLAAFLFVNNRSKQLLDEIEQYAVKLQNLLVARGRGKLTFERSDA